MKATKFIIIKWVPQMIHESNPTLVEYFKQHSRSIGAFFENGKKTPGTGLTSDEITILMPRMLDLEPTDRGFKTQVDLFFTEIDTKVPYDGLKINMSLMDDSKPLSEKNLPIDMEMYIAGRHALRYPLCGLGEESIGDATKLFLILDPSKQEAAELERRELVDQATAQYLNIKKDLTKVVELLTLMGVDPDEIPKKQHTSKLKDLVDKQPAKFLKLVEDPNVGAKFLLRNLAKYKIVTVVGTRYLDTETKKELGKTEMEAILHLQDKDNVKVLKLYDAKLKAAIDAVAEAAEAEA